MSPAIELRPTPRHPALTRRRLLLGGAGAAGVGAIGAASGSIAPFRLRQLLGFSPDPFVPDAAEGRVGLERVGSKSLGTDVDLFTAVPAGHGDGAGLPVVVVLHGASASAAELRGFGLARFVTAAVEQGAPPFALAGTDDGPAGWVSDGNGDPQAMLRDELPGWLADRGFDAGRRAVWGWSRGGYGALRMALSHPGWARAAALFSPALVSDDPVLEDLSPFRTLPLGVWCGREDPFYDGARALVDRLPARPERVTWGDGGHTRVYWNDHTIDALTWLSGRLANHRSA